jgi:branched-chain amino acid transport system permease protein
MGQGGMLSFGHAVYTGLGAYAAMHALNAVSNGTLPVPVSLVPLLGGVAGMGFAVLLGYVTTRKAGTSFAMITLGMAELVFAMSLMFSAFFGGEAGVTGNRVAGPAVWGITFGPQIQVYYLIAAYALVCTGLMFAFTHTPLGRLLNAVRDNAVRVEFIGYNPRKVRYVAFVIAGFFAGIAGGLAALNFEIVTAEVVSAARSGSYLLFTFLGGATFFFGPIIGAVLMVLATVLLSEFTQAWLLYLGFIFLFMVVYAPGGIASLLMVNLRVAAFGRLRALWPAYLAMGGAALVMLAGAGALVEMLYHRQLGEALGPELSYLGLALHTAQLDSWLGGALTLLTGLGLFELTRRQFARDWRQIQMAIEADIEGGHQGEPR